MTQRQTAVYQGDIKLEDISKEALKAFCIDKINLFSNDDELPKKEKNENIIRTETIMELEKLRDSDFEYLYDTLNFPLGITTLKRLWKYEKHKSPFGIITLNILANLAGYVNWANYLKQKVNIKPKQGDSLEYVLSTSQFFDAETDLAIGDIITLGNEYSRNVKLEYVDFLEFKVLEYNGRGDKKVGDIIEARWFDVIGPNFKDHKNADYDIIALMGELKSSEYVCSDDIDIYERLYL